MNVEREQPNRDPGTPPVKPDGGTGGTPEPQKGEPGSEEAHPEDENEAGATSTGYTNQDPEA